MKASLYSRNMLRNLCILFLFILSVPFGAFATHMRAGNILLVKQSSDCDNRRYKIRIIAYIDTESSVPFGGASTDVLFIFGKGGYGNKIPVPEITQASANGLNLIWELVDQVRHIARVEYTFDFSFPGNDTYTVSYTEVNRNANILNMSSSVNTPFYIETKITIDSYLGCSTPAIIEVPPVDRACSGITWTHNPGATDVDDSISYELAIPLQAPQKLVENYADVDDRKFYTTVDYAHASEDGQHEPRFSIDPVTGTITWDSPGNAGEYNIAFHIVEWRLKDGKRYRMGYVRRDMQIIVEDECKNERPDLREPKDTCVIAGTKLIEHIPYFDRRYFPANPANPSSVDKVNIKAYSQVFLRGALTVPDPENEQYIDSEENVNEKQMYFEWQTDCEDVRQQPYLLVFKVTDNGAPQLATFKTWRITVVGPPPVWNDRTLNVSTRTATLKWDAYKCANASTMQIWRRVDSIAYTPDVCETGMPPGLGYEKIDEVPASQTQYIDNNKGKGLASGARYCYRLVAVFPQPAGGESLVSSDTCLGPFLTADPIITKVSVVKTDLAAGKMRVEWNKPLNTTEVAPYKYEVYRAEGFTRDNDSTLVATVPASSATIEGIDDEGLNTEERVYNYSIVAYKNDIPFGWSAQASSVRLGNEAQVGKIILQWSATVPWSNQVTDPTGKLYRHRIYRGPEGSTDEQLVDTLATIDATVNGLVFTDSGPFNVNTKYCYRVETYGNYGNDDLPDPLINSSQVMCTEPGDSIPPCAPNLTAELSQCEELLKQGLLCDANTFENTINWTKENVENCDDIRKYQIFAANRKGGTFDLIAEVPATSFSYVDKDLLSFARCYKIRAVDASNNVGEFSQEVCNDNCPQYVLPNVFTPNGDNKNDLFSAYSVRKICREGNCANVPNLEEQLEFCARFVENVRLTVYNRWGQEVYSYQSDTGGENTIYIDWNGRDSSGQLVHPGIYYYVAEVTFDTVDPKKNTKLFKSWVHILYDSN